MSELLNVKVHSDHIYMSGSHRDKVRTFKVKVLMGGETLMERKYHAPYYADIVGYNGVARGERDAKRQAMKEFASKMRTVLS